MATDRLEIAARWEGSDAYPGMPESQIGTCVRFPVIDQASLAVETLHGTFDGDDDRDTVTAQLAVEF